MALLDNFLTHLTHLFREPEKNCVQIPLNAPGALYVSPMPFGPYDPSNVLLKAYKQHGIEFVVMLVTDDELKRKAKKDVISIYKKNGIEPIRFPIADYTCPDLHQASKLVDQVCGYLRAGAHVAVHCNAGVGRTGVVAGCIVRDIMKLSAEEAIDYVKQYMQIDMTDEQIRLVGRFNTLSEELEAKENS